jgi:predicted SAM-dependent methyltransferase
MISQDVKDFYYVMVRWLTLPNTWMARVRFRNPPPQGYAIHLGCGVHYIKGMINVDGNICRKKELWHDLRNRLPFPDKSAHFVYSSNVLEHIFPWESLFVLREIRRILRPDGIARISVPSMEHALDICAGRATQTWPMQHADPLAQAIEYLFIQGQHKYGFSAGLLEEHARKAGFTRVFQYSQEHGCAGKRYGDVAIERDDEGNLVVELQP